MWHHVTNHLITSNDKDSNSENRIKLRVRDNIVLGEMLRKPVWAKNSIAPTTLDLGWVHHAVEKLKGAGGSESGWR
jgi:hypothetical protein